MLRRASFSVLIKIILLLSAQIAYASTNTLADISPRTPDPSYTSGKLCSRKNVDFAGYRYDQKIPYCERNVDNSRKAEVYDYYRVPANLRRFYTIDHFIPLSIGGDNSIKNLWPEHKKIKETRQNLELEIFEAVRDSRMTQEEAVQRIIDAKMNPPIQ